MIYVPDDSYSCYTYLDPNTLRAYESIPTLPSDVNYIDYFVNSHYASKTGTEHFNSTDMLPNCISNSSLTKEVYYRNDFDSILLIFVLLSLICFYLPTRLVFKLFRKKGV